MQKFVFLLSISCIMAILSVSCVKSCQCTLYTADGTATETVVERGVPKGYGLDCDAASDYVEDIGGYNCK